MNSTTALSTPWQHRAPLIVIAAAFAAIPVLSSHATVWMSVGFSLTCAAAAWTFIVPPQAGDSRSPGEQNDPELMAWFFPNTDEPTQESDHAGDIQPDQSPDISSDTPEPLKRRLVKAGHWTYGDYDVVREPNKAGVPWSIRYDGVEVATTKTLAGAGDAIEALGR